MPIAATLRCDGWVCAAYTLHADDSVRQAATDVISRVLHALPQMRSGLIKGMAVCAADIPSELSDVSTKCLRTEKFQDAPGMATRPGLRRLWQHSTCLGSQTRQCGRAT